MAAEDREAYVKKVMQALPLLAPPKEAPAVEGARDIAELDALASEIQVCVTKSNNYVDSQQRGSRHPVLRQHLHRGEQASAISRSKWLPSLPPSGGASLKVM